MLRGTKPLAVFADGYGFFPDCVLRYLRLFDRHVESGKLSKREFVIPTDANPSVRGIHYVMYSLAAEEWRLDAMAELKLSTTWSRDKERKEGELLGYSAAECDAYMETFQSRR